MNTPHIPVLQNEVLTGFQGTNLSVFFDGTLGFGGHAKALLKEHTEIETYIGFDQDEMTLEEAKENLKEFSKKVRFVSKNFSELKEYLIRSDIEWVDGFLFDIGVSSMQLDRKEKGFSFNHDGPLDMRMNKNEELTAEMVVNQFPEKKLSEIFFTLGEEPFARKIAKAIVIQRKKKRLKSTFDLVSVIESVKKRRGRMHPATLVFQALRIFVNRELEAIEEALKAAIQFMKEGSKIAVISFHSLEDRIVKHFFKEISRDKTFSTSKKPIVATREEIKANSRSRSAKLRFLVKETT